MSRRSFVTTWRYRFARTKHDKLTVTAIAVAWTLSDYADWETGGDIRPGNQRVAEVLGIHVDTVKSAIKMLISEGWIECIDRGRGRGHASTYRLTIPAQQRGEGTNVVLLPVAGYGGATTPISEAESGSYGGPGPRVMGVVGPPHLYQYLVGGALALRRAS